MPIFRVKSVKTYTGQKKLHGYIRGIRDKYQVWTFSSGNSFFDSENINMTVFEIMMTTVMTHLQRKQLYWRFQESQWGRSERV